MLFAMVIHEIVKREVIHQPGQIAEGEIAPFTLLLPIQLKGGFFAHGNAPAHIFKSYVRILTEGVAPRNTTGEIASALVLGFMDQVHPQRTGLYTLEGEGGGITFNDPVTLYNNWEKVERRVGEKKQIAMRHLLLNRANPERSFRLLKKYIAYNRKDSQDENITS
jgi:hypothetical protein